MMRGSSVLAGFAFALLTSGCFDKQATSTNDQSTNVPSTNGQSTNGPPLTTSSCGCPGVDKVTICHVPPGDPGNAHSITIDCNGLHGHQHHALDTCGPCAPSCVADG